MCRRVLDRVAFGRPLAAQGVIQEAVADSRIRLEQLRLQVLRCARARRPAAAPPG
jgi:acyl-CoA dehydrogenase